MANEGIDMSNHGVTNQLPGQNIQGNGSSQGHMALPNQIGGSNDAHQLCDPSVLSYKNQMPSMNNYLQMPQSKFFGVLFFIFIYCLI